MVTRSEKLPYTPPVPKLSNKLKVFADTASLKDMRTLVAKAGTGAVAGFTTNPSLMRAEGVKHYRAFAKKALEIVRNKPISFEVVTDDLKKMANQAREITSWGGDNARPYVKVPVMTTDGTSTVPLLRELSRDGVALNVTAVFTQEQVEAVGKALEGGESSVIVSIFAGRIADAGVDPLKHVKACGKLLRTTCPGAEMLWASSRQAYDAILADQAGCDIITMTPSLIKKLPLIGKDLDEFSKDTVKMFNKDVQEAGYVF